MKRLKVMRNKKEEGPSVAEPKTLLCSSLFLGLEFWTLALGGGGEARRGLSPPAPHDKSIPKSEFGGVPQKFSPHF